MNQLKFHRITLHKHKEKRITLKKTPTPLRTYNKNLNNMSQHDTTQHNSFSTRRHDTTQQTSAQHQITAHKQTHNFA